MSETSKKLSIITICYNAEAFLDSTIKSIIKNKPTWVEYLIIDGLSKDDTLQIANNYKAEIDSINSEVDKGIYDAMNKGLLQANGEYVLFMNAGDTLESEFYLEFDEIIKENPDVVYGETKYVNLKGDFLGTRSNYTSRKLPEALNKNKFLWGQVVSHQSFIPKKEHCLPFDTNYKIAADYKWMLDVFNQIEGNPKCIQTKHEICSYLIDGASVEHRNLGLKERYKIMGQNFGWFRNNFYHFLIIIKGSFTKLKKGHLD